MLPRLNDLGVPCGCGMCQASVQVVSLYFGAPVSITAVTDLPCRAPTRWRLPDALTANNGNRPRSPVGARHPDLTVVVAPRRLRDVTNRWVHAPCSSGKPPRIRYRAKLRAHRLRPRPVRVALSFRVMSEAPTTRLEAPQRTAFPLSQCSRSGYRPVSKRVHRGVPVHSGRISVTDHVT